MTVRLHQDQILITTRPESRLIFQGSQQSFLESKLTLHNPTSQPTSFRIASTFPGKFVATPNHGILHPHQSTTLRIKHTPLISGAYGADDERPIYDLLVLSRPVDLNEEVSFEFDPRIPDFTCKSITVMFSGDKSQTGPPFWLFNAIVLIVTIVASLVLFGKNPVKRVDGMEGCEVGGRRKLGTAVNMYF